MGMTFNEDFLSPPNENGLPVSSDGSGQNAGQDFTPRDSSAPDTIGTAAFADACFAVPLGAASFHRSRLSV